MEPTITSDGSCTFLSERYRQTYHSTHGAVAEACHVFLGASGVAARLNKGLPCKILEVGFGLGLNYLLTADLAYTRRAKLYYEAWEHDPISRTQMIALDYTSQLTNPAIAESLINHWPVQPATTLLLDTQKSRTSRRTSTSSRTSRTPKNRRDLTPLPETPLPDTQEFSAPLSEAPLSDTQEFSESIAETSKNQLLIHFTDFCQAQLAERHFDAIYLDAFSPDVNPECWTPEIFSRLHKALKPSGKLATYCAKGDVRRAMEDSGFTVARLPGPTGKREILTGSAG